jgi:hypothetical protein
MRNDPWRATLCRRRRLTWAMTEHRPPGDCRLDLAMTEHRPPIFIRHERAEPSGALAADRARE